MSSTGKSDSGSRKYVVPPYRYELLSIRRPALDRSIQLISQSHHIVCLTVILRLLEVVIAFHPYTTNW